MSTSDPPEPGVVDSGGVKPMLISWLLSSIKRAMSRNANRKELAAVIDRDTDEFEIKEAWTMLFSLFSDAEDKSQKKKDNRYC